MIIIFMVLVNMNAPRMNHACLKIGNSIYVAGGVTTDNFDQRLVTKKVERLSNTNTYTNTNTKTKTSFMDDKTSLTILRAGTTFLQTVGSLRRTFQA